MSGYPPPPPNPSASEPFDRAAWKAQQRAWKAQARLRTQQQKAQARLDRARLRASDRLYRRGSMTGPLLLIAVGVVVLLVQTGALSWSHTVSWYGRWWPLVLIGAGVLLLAEWTWVRQRQQAGVPVSAPSLGGGVVFLLLLLALLGSGMRVASEHRDWRGHWMRPEFARMMGEAHQADDVLASPIATGQILLIRCPHGDVTITGSSPDNAVHVNVHKQVYSWNDAEAQGRLRDLQPALENSASQVTLSVPEQDGSQADLTIEVPHSTAVTVESGRGDITVNELKAPATLTAGRGNVDLNAIDGAVTVHVSHDSASISGRSINGPVTVQGRSGDISFSDVAGPLVLEGDFFGSTHLERIANTVRFVTSRTQFEAGRLDGNFEVDTGADLQARQVLGPVTLSARNRNITLDRVQGHVSVVNRNGTVNVTTAAPFEGVQITNQRGTVDVGVPPKAEFSVNAQTRHGDIENDFGLSSSGSSQEPVLHGNVGSGGPAVSVTTSDGDITIRKTVAEPLPPQAPHAPKLTIPALPAPPAVPIPPAPPAARRHTGGHSPEAPTPPQAPEPPAAA